MPKDTREVFSLLVVDEDFETRDIAGIIAFGLFSKDINTWVHYRNQQDGSFPDSDQINKHIEKDLAPAYFSELKQKAFQVFAEASFKFMSESLEKEKRSAIEQSIVSEIKSHNANLRSEVIRNGNVWRQLGLALITAIVSPLILGAMIVFAQHSSFFMTPSDIAKELTQQNSTPQSPER